MGKRPTKDQAWTIYRLRETPAEMLGRMYTPDQKATIAVASEQFETTNREQKERLIATRSG